GPAAATGAGMVKRVAHVGRDEILVAGVDPEPAQGQLERHTSGRDRRRVLGAETPGERTLEPRDLGALGENAAADDAGDRLGILLDEGGSRVRDQMASNSLTDWNRSQEHTSELQSPDHRVR